MPNEHGICYEHKRSLFRVTISPLCTAAQSLSLSPGLPETLAHGVDPVDGISAVTKHSVPIATKLYCHDGPPFIVDVFVRSADCTVLCDLAAQPAATV